MKTLLISHTDLDGISCNLLLDLAGIKYDYYNVEVSEVADTLNAIFNNKDTTYDQIYIADLTVSKSDYTRLQESGINYLVFDHHRTHLYAKNFKNANIKVNEFGHLTCATELFYNYLKELYPNINTPLIASYVELVRQIDTYTMENDDPRDLSTLLFIYGKTTFLKKMKTRLKKEKESFTFTTFEKKYLSIQNAEFDAYCLRKEKELLFYEIKGYICGVVFCENTDKSELGHRLSKKHPELDLIILINPSRSISYRTERDDIDVSKFASYFGGGGHMKASGSDFINKNREDIIKSYYKDVKRLENPTN